MKQERYGRLVCAAAALALLLTGCGKSNSGSSGGSMSGSMGGASSGSGAQAGQQQAWRTGLGIVIETQQKDRSGEIGTIAAAVVLDQDGKILQLALDEQEAKVSTTGDGKVTMPDEYLSKREMGESYDEPLAAASSIHKGWSQQADAFATYLLGMTGEQVKKLAVDRDGYATDPDLLSGCTIAVDGYRDAVAKACDAAQARGAAQGDVLSVALTVQSAAGNTDAIDDRDGSAGVEATAVALTKDSDGRVTSAVCDESEPALTIAADGGIHEPDTVRSKLEMGDEYGMRKASALGKEWYEHSEGFADYIKGKNAAQIAGISADGSDADLAALCTIDITVLQKTALKALQ